MDMDWHILTMIPLVGLTAGWRGVRIGGKTLGMGGGLGSSNSPLVQAFDKAKAEGDRAAMERIARQMNEARLKQKQGKTASDANKAAKPSRDFTTSVSGNMTINDKTGDYILEEKFKGRDVYRVYEAGPTASRLVGTYGLSDKGRAFRLALQRLEEMHEQRKNDPSKFR